MPRMGFEREDGRNQFVHPRDCHHGPDHSLMAQMQPVEIADGDGCWAVGSSGKVADELHDSLYE